ncbi:type I-C CRISPR-associated protein Cas8c/Csd1 [Kitasatospora purpeofusca]|uniref:type I-C CRISPR-associated protein Cas8c/Csd1 n=1 Tax=Kitasatospora purpeofusca TaxID=67352 RepID=UPI0036D27F36
MLLQRLTERVAHQEQSYTKPATIKWAVLLDGDHTQIQDLRVPKGQPALRLDVPTSTRTVAIAPCLLADNAQYVFGVPKADPRTGEVKEKDAVRAAKCRTAFAELARQWAAANPGDPTAQAVVRFLDTVTKAPEDMAAGDLVAISVDGQWAHQQASARQFWADKVSDTKGAGNTGLCLVCGHQRPLLATVPVSIAMGAIPAKQAKSTQLVSVNTAAQGRAGITAGLAATPLCETCGTAATTSLGELLADPKHRRRADTAVTVWWTREPVKRNHFGNLDDPQPEDVANLIGKIFKPGTGTTEYSADVNKFYSATLGANASRGVVRNWIDVPLPVIEDCLGRWFRDHQYLDPWSPHTTQDPLDPDSDPRYQVYPLWRLTLACARWVKTEKKYHPKTIPEGLDEALLHSALRGTPPPAWMLPRLLARIRADRRIDGPRTALLRLALTRHHTQEHGMPGLDPTANDPAYMCGRLFATLAAVQRRAAKEAGRKVNATITDKYFGTAMSSPATVFANLRAGAENHLRIIRRHNKQPTANALEARMRDIYHHLNDVPLLLTVPEQGRFVLGYEHQRAADITAALAHKAAKEKAAETAEPQPVEAGALFDVSDLIETAQADAETA